jgi:GT2 family glycosyltransferase
MNDMVVVIVSYHTRDLTVRAVTAARRASADLSAQVVVADNGSHDGTCEALRSAHRGARPELSGQSGIRRS